MLGTETAQSTAINPNQTLSIDDINRKLSFSSAISSDNSIAQVYLRIRPSDGDSETNNKENTLAGIQILSNTSLMVHPTLAINAPRRTKKANLYEFSRIFPPQTSQNELFLETAKPIIDGAMRGISGLLFAYGFTNSGKTYTISGTEENPGILPRTLEYVFNLLQPPLSQSEDSYCSRHFVMKGSYLEIYNEKVYDLLATSKKRRRALQVSDHNGKIHIKGLLERKVLSIQQGRDILAFGKKQKIMAATANNLDSSRGHCVFILKLYHSTDTNKRAMQEFSKISIVDLAGSERSARTGATGLRMQEATKINGSLMNLMNCFETLRWNQQHPLHLQKVVPFRQSKLTKLFQESLTGQAPLIMIVAINASLQALDESVRTLNYSALARELITVKPVTVPKRISYDRDGRLRKKIKVLSDVTAVEIAQDVQSTHTEDTLCDLEIPSSAVETESVREVSVACNTKDACTQTCKLESLTRNENLEREQLQKEMRIRREIMAELSAQFREFKEEFILEQREKMALYLHSHDGVSRNVLQENGHSLLAMDVANEDATNVDATELQLHSPSKECEEEMRSIAHEKMEAKIVEHPKRRKSVRIRRLLER